VGLVLSRKYGYEINVVDAILGSPADKAGIATGDIVESINVGILAVDLEDRIESWFEQIHAPMGLDLGAEAPASIALSILAEMQQSLRRLHSDGEVHATLAAIYFQVHRYDLAVEQVRRSDTDRRDSGSRQHR